MLTGNGWKAISGQNCMNINQINAYLEGAREIMGERSQTEIAYDDAVVAHLSTGIGIKKAITAANHEYPSEALRPNDDQWDDVAARYDYMKEHKAILARLNINE